ncbi:hypothetical protein BT63DRAFT_426760 [Microthyrium microscopicum]|uniref:Uncharacterized protein n=1 Tax=Microthyrium microscopicum TaxID=703497 RepID=A0A6A6U9C5_9PEZI|nr:hypothetical protein BT63DRAFT_426760 [Microthyrium microscopicum]
MHACCNGADYIVAQDDCNIYCKVVGQIKSQLRDCLGRQGRMTDAQENSAVVICSSGAGRTGGNGVLWTVAIWLVVAVFLQSLC